MSDFWILVLREVVTYMYSAVVIFFFEIVAVIEEVVALRLDGCWDWCIVIATKVNNELVILIDDLLAVVIIRYFVDDSGTLYLTTA